MSERVRFPAPVAQAGPAEEEAVSMLELSSRAGLSVLEKGDESISEKLSCLFGVDVMGMGAVTAMAVSPSSLQRVVATKSTTDLKMRSSGSLWRRNVLRCDAANWASLLVGGPPSRSSVVGQRHPAAPPATGVTVAVEDS